MLVTVHWFPGRCTIEFSGGDCHNGSCGGGDWNVAEGGGGGGETLLA